MTLRTRELPQFFGGVTGTISAASDTAFRELISRAMSFYADRLMNPHWGEQMSFDRANKLEISMMFQGLTQREAEEVWKSVPRMVGRVEATISPLKLRSRSWPYQRDYSGMRRF